MKRVIKLGDPRSMDALIAEAVSDGRTQYTPNGDGTFELVDQWLRGGDWGFTWDDRVPEDRL